LEPKTNGLFERLVALALFTVYFFGSPLV